MDQQRKRAARIGRSVLTAGALALVASLAALVLGSGAGQAAGPAQAGGAVKMQPAEDYPHAGVSLALPQAYEVQTVGEPFDVARAVLLENNKPSQAITLSVYPIAEKVTAERFADAMMADLQKSLSISKLVVRPKSSLQVAGVEAQVRLLSYEFRGSPTVAIKVLFTREEKHAQAPDGKVRLCYVLTAESVPERQGSLAAVLGEVVKSMKLVAIHQPMAIGEKSLAGVMRDYKMGFQFRPPQHWYARLTPSGVEAGLTDYILGGVPMPLLRIVVQEPASEQTAQQASKKILETLKQNASVESQEVTVISEGPATLGPLEAHQALVSQAPTSRPARLKADEEPAVLIAYRTTGSVEVPGRLPRTYWLAVYCQSPDASTPLSIVKAVAESFQVVQSATASAPSGTSLPSSGAATSTSGPATRPAGSTAPAGGTTSPAGAVP